MAMQIYSKLERALGSIHIPLFPTCLSRFQSSSLLCLLLFLFPVVFALPGKMPAVTGVLGSPRKTADYTPENSALRRFVPIDRRDLVARALTRGNKERVIESRIEGRRNGCREASEEYTRAEKR